MLICLICLIWCVYYSYADGLGITVMQTDWVIWQLADSAFPSGGFAHSGGLESTLQWHEVDRQRFPEFVRAYLIQIGHGSLPIVIAAHRKPEQIVRLDGFCDTFYSNHVANRASRIQGRSFLASAEAAFASQGIQKVRGLLNRGRIVGHFPSMFGVVAATLQLHARQAKRLFLFVTMRSLISSAIRLGIVGTLNGQAIQYQIGPLCERIAQKCGTFRPEEVAQTAPVIDVLQATHDRLYSRLFQS